MNKILINIDKKIDKLDTRLDKVDVTLVKQEANLEEHMRRTDLLEKQHHSFLEELKPIKSHVDQLRGVIKFLGIGAALAAIISAVFNLKV